MITKRQENKIDKAIKEKVGFILRMSESQVRKQSQNGGVLSTLAGLITKTIVPFATKFIPKIVPRMLLVPLYLSGMLCYVMLRYVMLCYVMLC